ncbi:hypothetical protein Tco_0725173 [Tanacetum coccineum]|uniref:Uncharacterized protein n=1 Tax=Tanacetum coccineum TaxID=301880 RepID=A0ABQ4YE88_9ASTR
MGTAGWLSSTLGGKSLSATKQGSSGFSSLADGRDPTVLPSTRLSLTLRTIGPSVRFRSLIDSSHSYPRMALPSALDISKDKVSASISVFGSSSSSEKAESNSKLFTGRCGRNGIALADGIRTLMLEAKRQGNEDLEISTFLGQGRSPRKWVQNRAQVSWSCRPPRTLFSFVSDGPLVLPIGPRKIISFSELGAASPPPPLKSSESNVLVDQWHEQGLLLDCGDMILISPVVCHVFTRNFHPHLLNVIAGAKMLLEQAWFGRAIEKGIAEEGLAAWNRGMGKLVEMLIRYLEGLISHCGRDSFRCWLGYPYELICYSVRP